MRIVVVTQDDPFYIRCFFEPFLERLQDDVEIAAAVICRTMNKSRLKLAGQLFGFYGPWDFTRMAARYAGMRLQTVLTGVTGGRPVTLQQLFAAHDVPVIACDNVNGRAMRQRLERLAPDLIVSVAAPQIFRKKLLALPQLGCINIHTARLPQYRGMMPNFWVLFHGERRSAITIHTMDADIDRGQTLLQREFDVQEGESLDHLIRRTKVLGAECMIEVLREIRQHGIRPIRPPAAEPSYFTFPTPDEVREFRRRGLRVL